MDAMTALCNLSAEETKNFIDTVIEEGLTSTTEHHHKLGAADAWNFTLSNGERFQLWERSSAFETIYTYYKQGIGSMQFKTLRSAVQFIKKFFKGQAQDIHCWLISQVFVSYDIRKEVTLMLDFSEPRRLH